MLVGASRRYHDRVRNFRGALTAVLLAGVAWSATIASRPAPATVRVETTRGALTVPVYSPVAPAPSKKPLVLILSGEGGWRAFDDLLASWLAADGYWVAGLDCKDYFWKPQDDRQSLARDVRALVGALAKRAGRTDDPEVLLAGFSFGADLAPWVAGAEAWEGRLAGLVMLGPDRVGSLEFRISEMIGLAPSDHVFDVEGALAGLSGVPVLFVHGEGDGGSDAPALAESYRGPKELVVIPGANHHFSGREEELRGALRDGLDRLLERAAPRR
jgi:type IV secretory pathway VirJ component